MITFEEFRLEDSPNCERDWLEIVETNTGTIVLEKKCGDTIPDAVKSNLNSNLIVKFRTDESDTDKGFKYSWWTGPDQEVPTTNVADEPEPTSCDGTITKMDCCKTALDEKCGYGEGDCDSDEQCAGDLM